MAANGTAPTGQPRRTEMIPGLEGVRLFAAVAVVFTHATLIAEPLRHGGPPGSWLARSAYLAVDVLFVVSGFAQFLPMATSGPDRLPSWRSYAVRRLARIVPPYWIACVATAVFIGHYTWGLGSPGRTVGLVEFIIHLLFLNHIFFGIVGRNGFGPNSAFWTMTSEALFYVCLPFVARRFLRHPFIGLIGALVIACGWRTMAVATGGSQGAQTNLVSQFPAWTFHFAMGMAAAMVAVRLRREPVPHLRAIAFVAVVWSVAAIAVWMRAVDPVHHRFSDAFVTDTRWLWNIGITVPIALLLASLSFAPRWSIFPLSNPVSRWLGEGTYGTYLFHTLLVVKIGDKLHQLGYGPMGLWQVGGAATIEALLIGRLSYTVVEEPTRRAAKRLAARLDAAKMRKSTVPPARDRPPPSVVVGFPEPVGLELVGRG